MLNDVMEKLKNGGVIIYPTETAYGLGCDATNLLAVNKVFTKKNRLQHMPLSIIVADMEMAEQYGVFTDEARKLAHTHWPGPLTLIVQCKESALAPGTFHKDGSIAMRISSHKTAHEIVTEFGKPIVATSANVSGKPTCYDIPSIKEHMDTHDVLIIDEGDLGHTPTTTIIDARKGRMVIRQGTI